MGSRDHSTECEACGDSYAALAALRALVAQLDRIGGYSSHEEQAAVREARAVVAEWEAHRKASK